MAYKKPLYEEVKNTLDNVGKGMCLAKWTQVTAHLHTGHNHSCHHPNTHKISEAEIARNPSAIHNTLFKKKNLHFFHLKYWELLKYFPFFFSFQFFILLIFTVREQIGFLIILKI